MESSLTTSGDTRRRAYGRPRLRKIELLAEEVLLSGCKGPSGPAINSSDPSCLATTCHLISDTAS